jgi:hypothetical protein
MDFNVLFWPATGHKRIAGGHLPRYLLTYLPAPVPRVRYRLYNYQVHRPQSGASVTTWENPERRMPAYCRSHLRYFDTDRQRKPTCQVGDNKTDTHPLNSTYVYRHDDNSTKDSTALK